MTGRWASHHASQSFNQTSTDIRDRSLPIVYYVLNTVPYIWVLITVGLYLEFFILLCSAAFLRRQRRSSSRASSRTSAGITGSKESVGLFHHLLRRQRGRQSGEDKDNNNNNTTMKRLSSKASVRDNTAAAKSDTVGSLVPAAPSPVASPINKGGNKRFDFGTGEGEEDVIG